LRYLFRKHTFKPSNYAHELVPTQTLQPLPIHPLLNLLFVSTFLATGRKISIVVLGNAQWPVLRRYVERVAAAVNATTPGSFAEVEIPFE